jgi:mediator of RNA polymerase II transcription subunit 31
LEERKEKEERERRENLHMRSYIHTLFERRERDKNSLKVGKTETHLRKRITRTYTYTHTKHYQRRRERGRYMTATATKDDVVVVGDDLKKQSQLDEEKTRCSNKERFELELEFIQSLANPRYLHHLATTPCSSSSSSSNGLKADDNNDILNSEEMVEYLSYLQYWYKDPRYSKYILYPHCLYFLKLLQEREFRVAMRNPRRVEEVHVAQFNFWAYDLTERVRKMREEEGEKMKE